MGGNRVIGFRNRLPWRLPADLRRFRAITMGKPVIMGRRTFESIGKPLPGRDNIVVTRNRQFRPDGCRVFSSTDDALTACRGQPEIMVIGGASLYAQILPDARRMYLTLIQETFSGDVFFPAYDEAEWVETDRENYAADAENPYPYSFVVMDRNDSGGPP